MKKRFRIGISVILAALLLLNVAAFYLHKRLDLTEEGRYSLSPQVRALLDTLKEPVQIDVLLEGNDLPPAVRRFRGALDDFLREMGEASGGKFSYRFVNPYTLSDTASEATVEDSLYRNYGLIPFVIDAPSGVGDKLEISKLVHGAVIHYGDSLQYPVNFLEGLRGYDHTPEGRQQLYNAVEASLEYKFASALQKVSATSAPMVAWLTGHGEAYGYHVDDALRTIAAQYDADTLNLTKVPYIAPGIAAVVVAKPTRAFSKGDKLKLDQYVLNGGRLLLMVDNMYAEFDSLYNSNGFVSFDRGLELEDLLFNWGVRLNQTLLQDRQSDTLVQRVGKDETAQNRKVAWPFSPLVTGTAHSITKNIDPVRVLFPTTIDTVEAPGIRKTVLLQSSPNSRHLPAPAKIDFDFLQIAPGKDLFRQPPTPVAVLLEGAFTSLYAGRVSGSTRDSFAAAGVPILSEGKGSRIVLVSDGDLPTNSVHPERGPLPMGVNPFIQRTYANKDFYLNALEYLTNPADLLSTRAKEFSLRLLDPARVEGEKGKWQAINLLLPLVLLALFAGGWNAVRKHKYKNTN